MLCLIKSQELLHIIAEYPFPGDKHDNLVKGWIFGTMNDKLLKDLLNKSINSAHKVWMELESSFMPPISHTEDDSLNARDVPALVSAIREDLKYMQASNVNVSNFVSVKLSGHINYQIWKTQMLCLLRSQELLHIIRDETDHIGDHVTEKYNNLVKGWILSSMNEQVLKNDYVHLNTATYIWRELESTFTNPSERSDQQDVTLPGFIVRRESIRISEIEDTDNIRRRRKKDLYEAVVEGCWWKAKSILKTNKSGATEAITTNGNTILHLAVEMGHNYFLEKLLEFLKDGKDLETQNDKGLTALHIAAVVGNKYAAQLLIQKRKQLLLIREYCDLHSPLDSAFSNMNLDISAYLMKSAQSSDDCYSDAYQENAGKAIAAAIFTKQYDFARSLLEKYPNHAKENDEILLIIMISFPTDLSFMESFIYPSFHNVCQKISMTSSSLFHYNVLYKFVDDVVWAVKICSCNCLGKFSMILLVPVSTLYLIHQLIFLLVMVLRVTFSMLYFLVWKFLAATVHPIKNIERKKKEYEEAKKTLSLICNQKGTSKDGYSESILEAVRQGTYEVVDEILSTSPATINSKNEEGHNVIQLAIINRSEKVYNLLYHIVERTESYRTMTDSSNNNLAHLAGRLAPSFALNRTTGAALQLQRELLWREEVEKMMSPIDLLVENINNETPAMVFTKEHQDLLKQGENWMKTTAESCSITAALIVTIVFAAAITVPGGSNQESGIPVFKKETAFTIFAISNAFSLFAAATALLLFLSILTARFSEKDFLVSLPRRLILGLLMLFLSTTTMIVAFGAILFLVFCDQRPWMLALICAFACLPISVMVTIKLPLLADLIKSTYFPIFGKQSYLEFCKVNRKSTILE